MSPSTPAFSPAKINNDVAEENPDLVKFRQEWLAELRRQGKVLNTATAYKEGRIAETLSSASRTTDGDIASGLSVQQSSISDAKKPSFTQKSQTSVAPHPALKNGGIVTQFPVSKSLENALEIYKKAIHHEQRGDLDDALRLYRQAFRLDDNVDRAYHREQMLKSILKDEQETPHRRSSFADTVHLSSISENAVSLKPAKKSEAVHATGTLANVVQQFPNDVKFQPENDAQPLLLSLIPDEMLVAIISKLDPTSIERFARVCKKARLLTLDSGVWSPLVYHTYRPPQISDMGVLLKTINTCSFDYRRVFIELPRLRLDGVYIATCLYTRPGLSENHWVNITHLVTYHRYLRFFPNGQVLSLLANEEHAPQLIIPLLKPTLRMKGLFIGQWSLVGTTVHLSNLADASGRFVIPEVDDLPFEKSSASVPTSGVQMRYVFTMTLELRSRPLGRWNRMDIQAYDSVNIETGEVNPVLLKHERPFWFSKVRSFT